MKIYFGQIYLEPGVAFPFSHLFQRRLSDEITALVAPSEKFIQRFGDDWDLMLRISAKRALLHNEIRGPSVNKKEHHVMSSSTPPIPIPRSRPLYALAAVLVIAAGLLWRSGLLPLPPFLIKYGGDALWALLVFLAVGFLFPRASTPRVAISAIAIAWTVEFLQLYHVPWLDAVRATRPGRLVLGSTFNTPDLLAYLFGIALGAWAEVRRRAQL